MSETSFMQYAMFSEVAGTVLTPGNKNKDF